MARLELQDWQPSSTIPENSTVIKNTGTFPLNAFIFDNTNRPSYAVGVVPAGSSKIATILGSNVVVGTDDLNLLNYSSFQGSEPRLDNTVTVGTKAAYQDLTRNVQLPLPVGGNGILTAHTIPLANMVTVISASVAAGSDLSIGLQPAKIPSLVPTDTLPAKPFYQTMWFIILCIVLVFAIGAGIWLGVVKWKGKTTRVPSVVQTDMPISPI